MKLYVLNNGYLETDQNNILGNSVLCTRSQPDRKCKWIRLPVLAFLIETVDGYTLFDTGCNPRGAEKGYWATEMWDSFLLTQTPEERLEHQLKLCGVTPADIHTVVLSHFHMDHAGNMDLFPHANVYVPKADFAEALLHVHVNPDLEAHVAYVKAEVTAPAHYIPVEDDFELAPGIEVINLPGHTAGLLGLVLHLDGGVYILPQDCVYLQENFGPPARASGDIFDSISFYRSIEKLRRLQNKYKATIIYPHDWEFAKQLRFAPEYYE